MACRVYCELFIKKISSLIKRLSGENERERRAYEEPEESIKDKSSLSIKIENIIKENYDSNAFVYTYYKYVDKFHVEPKDWRDLFEYITFDNTESLVNKVVQEEVKNGN